MCFMMLKYYKYLLFYIMNIVKLERSLRSVQFYESVRRLSTVSQQIQNQVKIRYMLKKYE